MASSVVLAGLIVTAVSSAGFNELPLSLGIRTKRGLMLFLLERGTPLPAQSSKFVATTTVDDQKECDFEIYTGLRPVAKGNQYVGGTRLVGLPTPSARGYIAIDVSVAVQRTGDFEFQAKEQETGNETTFVGNMFDVVPPSDKLIVPVVSLDAETGAHKEKHRSMDSNDEPDEEHSFEVGVFDQKEVDRMPLRLRIRDIRIEGMTFRIRQNLELRKKLKQGGTGGALWESAIILSSYLIRGDPKASYLPASFKGHRVLELGCGCGLVSIVLSRLGAEVTATDIVPAVLQGAESNAALNEVHVNFAELNWGDLQSIDNIVGKVGKIDLIVGTDLIFPAAPAVVFVNALKNLFSRLPNVSIILAAKNRFGEVPEFLKLAEDSPWEVTHIKDRAVYANTLFMLHIRQAAREEL